MLNTVKNSGTSKQLILAILIVLLTSVSFAQVEKNHLFMINETSIGGYVGINGRFSSVESNLAGYLDGKIVAVINENWGIGFSFSGLHYDRGLNKVVDDGSYHLNAAYAGIYVERIFSLSNDFKLSVSITSGMGEAYYQYDKDYRKDKVWTEEIIDKTSFAIFEPALELQYNILGNYWIGIIGSFRNTSPLELIGADEHLFQKFSGGITIKYGLF